MDIDQVSDVIAFPKKRSPAVAMVWSVVFAGLGQFYNGDALKGVAFVISAIVCCLVFWPLWVVVMLFSVGDACGRAVQINEKIDLADTAALEHKKNEEAVKAAHTKVADLVIKVEKIYALNKSGLLSEEEYRSKVSHLISELSEKKPFENAEDFLTALIPLVSSGALNADDLSRIKAVL